MNKLFTFCLLCCTMLLSTGAFAQKCKFEQDEADPFTKELVRSSGPIDICAIPRWWAVLEQKGNKYSLSLNISQLKEVQITIASGTRLLIKLEDGTVLEPVITDDAIPIVNVELNQYVVTQWKVHTLLTEELLKQFSQSPIEFIRVKIGRDDFNMPEAKSKGTKKLMQLAGCLLSKE